MNLKSLLKQELSNFKSLENIFLSWQYTLACFSGIVIIPLLLGISPSVSLFASGVATLIYSIITKGKIGIFLGASAAYVSAFLQIKGTMSINYAVGAYLGSALVFFLFSFIAKYLGYKTIKNIFADTVTGSIVVCIGISLLPISLSMMKDNYILAFSSILLMVVLNSLPFKNVKRFSVLLTILIMYITSIFLGYVDFGKVVNAHWFSLPNFVKPQYDLNAILLMAIVTIIGVAEHIGEVRANGLILGNDHFKNPGVHRSLFGDGIAMLLVSLGMTQGITTYGESNAVSSISGNKNTALIRGAGVLAVILSLVGKFGAILETIPMPIIGGISLLLFATLTNAGLNVIKDTNENIMDFKNTLVIAIPIFITISSLLPENPLRIIVNNSLTLEGLSLATIVGIVLNLIIPKSKKVGD